MRLLRRQRRSRCHRSLTVTEFGGYREGRKRRATWQCTCECGVVVTVLAQSLKNGLTLSCGCYHSDVMRQHTKHGLSRVGKISPTYKVWSTMIQRCTNPKNAGYENYGGRGVTVCDRWRDFAAFVQDMGECPIRGMSIERKDNDGNYCKDNCTWATPKQQARNTRTNHRVTCDGQTLCIAEWSEKSGVSRFTILQRLRRGWLPHDAIYKTPKSKIA